VAANGLLNGVDLDVSALYSAAPIPQAAVTTPPMPTSAPTISALPTAPLATAAQPVFNTLLQQSSPNLASYLSANTSITAPELATLSTDYKTKLQATNDYLGKADSIVGAESTGLGGVKGLYDTISKDIKTLDDLNPTDALLSAASAMLQMPYVKGLMSEDLNQGLQYGVTGAGVFTACLELAAATTPAGIAVAGALAILAASDFALQSLNLATEAATLADPPDQNYL
jgi:hypothetical protein